MNPLEELPYLGKPLAEAEEMLRAAGYETYEIIRWNDTITLQVRYYPMVFLNKEGKVDRVR